MMAGIPCKPLLRFEGGPPDLSGDAGHLHSLNTRADVGLAWLIKVNPVLDFAGYFKWASAINR